MGVAAIRKSRNPEVAEIANAPNGVNCPLRTIEARKIFGPREVTMPMGRLLVNPDKMQVTPEENAEATTACLLSVRLDKIAAFSTKLLADARNAVVPAPNSRMTVLPRAATSKRLSNCAAMCVQMARRSGSAAILAFPDKKTGNPEVDTGTCCMRADGSHGTAALLSSGVRIRLQEGYLLHSPAKKA
mmetsp:Transcript_12835/g.24682  ORF Transcript_12835/g.24682 Transcript_12835/m.24682 type:complete len:187 (-) Transcript_12835:3-563(-)